MYVPYFTEDRSYPIIEIVELSLPPMTVLFSLPQAFSLEPSLLVSVLGSVGWVISVLYFLAN